MPGTIFRDITERFNPQIHTEEKSLTVNMEKDFAVKRKAFDLFKGKNKFVSWLYATNRINMGVPSGKVMSASSTIRDNAYRVKYKGSMFIPAYSAGTAQFGSFYTTDTDMVGTLGAGITYTNGVLVTTVDFDVKGTIAVKHDPANNIFGDKFNPGDAIALDTFKGSQFIVAERPVKASTGDHYLVNVKVASDKALFAAAHLADGELLSEAGNRFGEGSNRGYQRERRSKWRINYSFISRVTLTMTGSAMSQNVVNLTNSETGASMWDFEQVLELRERHAINMELGARYARSTMNASTHSWFEDYGTNKLSLDGFDVDMGVVAPVIGDGWIPQLDDAFSVEYDPNARIPVDLLEMFMIVLSQRSPSGTTGNVWVGIGDKLAHKNIDSSFKLLLGWASESGATMIGSTNIVKDVKTGQDNALGFVITKYHYLHNTFIFLEDELMNNPAFAAQNGGVIGTGTIYVLNASLVDGVSNIDLLARDDRELRAKYVDGMHSLNRSNNNSASGFDGARFDILSEILPIIYSTESCGVIKPSAKFTGGALTGEPIISENATAWHY